MRSLTALVLFIFALFGSAASAQSAPPNVLVIVVDDMGWEDVATAPLARLSAYASVGRVYTRYYTNPVCSPSRAALLCGEYPHRHFIGTSLHLTGGLPARTKSVADVFAANGYSTALFGKSHVMTAQLGAEAEAARVHGFETWRAGGIGNLSTHYGWTRTDDGIRSFEPNYSTTVVIEETVAWWSATDGPKFAVLAPFAPHEPFQAPPSATLPPGYVVGALARDIYEASLASLDNQLGALLAVIDPAQTHVVFLCDNGTPHQVPPPNAQSKGYKLTPYEGGVHVPLVWWGPGVAPGVDESLVQVVDVPRTLLDVCGLVPVKGFGDSISFAQTLSGQAGARNYALLTRFTPNGGLPTLVIDDWAVVRADGRKLVSHAGVQELYNLNVDPWETFQLAPFLPINAATIADLEHFRLTALGPAWPY